MKRHVARTVLLTTAMLVVAAVSPVVAQETTAEVKTWGGQSVVLAGPWVDVFFNALPWPLGGEPAGVPPVGGPAPAMTTGGAGGTQPEIRGSFQSLRHAFQQEGPQALRGQRETSVLTLSRDGLEVKVPLERLAMLTIARQPVAASSLPPYISPTHQRYGATAILTDGSRIDADYFNFGTAVLRGMTPQGRVDVPFEQIESIRFSR
jgi:hypothetical protein